MLSREQHDAQEEIYEILLKEVETLCEGGVPASDITHALIRNVGRVGCGLHSQSGRGA
jgi:hypothetical protein